MEQSIDGLLMFLQGAIVTVNQPSHLSMLTEAIFSHFCFWIYYWIYSLIMAVAKSQLENLSKDELINRLLKVENIEDKPWAS